MISIDNIIDNKLKMYYFKCSFITYLYHHGSMCVKNNILELRENFQKIPSFPSYLYSILFVHAIHIKLHNDRYFNVINLLYRQPSRSEREVLAPWFLVSPPVLDTNGKKRQPSRQVGMYFLILICKSNNNYYRTIFPNHKVSIFL